MQFEKSRGWLDWYADPSKPGFALPPGPVDAHCRVFGPGESFPYADERKYTPCDASKQQLFALRDHMGRPDVRKPVDGPEFELFVKLMREHDNVWSKLSCPERLSVSGAPALDGERAAYRDVVPLVGRELDKNRETAKWFASSECYDARCRERPDLGLGQSRDLRQHAPGIAPHLTPALPDRTRRE